MKLHVRQLALAVGLCCGGMGAAHAQVVISQVYGSGGNSGATLKSDFIELRNNGATAVDLSTWSVQYASSVGTTWQRTNLTGSIAAGGYYLVKEADGAGGSTALPTPDATGTIAMSGTAGKVALVANQVTLSGACPLASAVDFVGYGSANCFEGTAPAPSVAAFGSDQRKNNGTTDTNNNAADFQGLAADPHNSGSAPPPPPDPATPMSIHDVQGNGLQSPVANQRVEVQGVVTAKKFNNGFFLQVEDANVDADPATSEGVFVFTSTAPTVNVGDRVKVTAKVQEYTPSTNLNQLSITEMIEPTVEVLTTGNAIPAPVVLDSALLNASALPGTLERLEGMRVSMAQAVVVGASDGSINEANATSTTDGVFYVTAPDVATPFREPGIGVLDTIAIPAGKTPPRFDTNQERLMVRSRGQVGALPIAVDDEATIGNLEGVLDYFDGTWALLPDANKVPVVAGGKVPTAVDDARYEEATIGGFNLLRFFDEVPDGNGAPTLTPAALDMRLGKTAWAICDYLKTPDILGVVEVENLRILQLLSARIDATCPSHAPHYVPYLVPGNDVGGINVGVLASTRDNGAGVPRVEVASVTQFGKDATFANPNGTTSLLNDRPPLVMRAIVHQDNGATWPVSVVVNHLRSLNGVDDSASGSSGWATEGARVRGKRAAQAAYTAGLIESMQSSNPGERIVLVGDFNAFEFNDGYVDVLGVVKGSPAPDAEVLTAVPSPLTTPLVDGSEFVPQPRERYSYVFEGNAQSLDHVLLNQALIADAMHVEVDHPRINADFGVDNFGDASTPVRVSDHDPVRVRVSLASFRSADVRMAMTAPATVLPGNTAHFDAQVDNAGPNAALNASVAFVLDGAWSPTMTVPAGWTCDAPLVDATTTTVLCRNADFASAASASFGMDVAVPVTMVAGSVHVAASVASSITDPANANNGASATVAIDGRADLRATVSGPVLGAKPNVVAHYPARIINAGPAAAWQPVLHASGDVAPNAVVVNAPAGWTCAKSAAPVGFQVTCTLDGAMGSNGVWTVDLAITSPQRPANDLLDLSVDVTSASPDPVTGNNTATSSTRIR
ncbi:nuclease [Lysobacter helvus]|uniref:Nuclease n=2 Tax=Lysobacteraceae TaxID=32033 RepID=A0ABM7Q403_9GAMM|nr:MULTISPECIES: lamin tail domain-containing protein [Lysobacter]BCT91906.1 nuclease [Lysobacter caseinilyticus]BCT95059.1 nuclease [Lysobacter helvus]